MGKEQITYRDFKNFNDIEFICDIKSIDWSYAPKTTMQTWVLRSSCLFNKCLDKNAPLKTVSKIGEKVLQKPWITNGIKTSIKVRDKLYKQMIKQKDAILKNQKQMLYKRYRNKIVDLLKITKEAYYKNCFQENRKNSRALWSGINEIIYSKKSSKTIPPSSISVEGKTISDPQNIAENFNNFFTSIGKNIQKKIFPTKKQLPQRPHH